MTTSIVRRIDSRNLAKITHDIDACLFYVDCNWTLIDNNLHIHNGAFQGVWTIVKHNKSLWSGHNGYTFERTNSTGDTLQLWEITPRTAPIVTVEEALETQEQARIEATDRAFDTLNAAIDVVNACISETEVYNFTNGIDFRTWSGATVASLTDAVEAKLATFKTPVDDTTTAIARAQALGMYVLRCKRCGALHIRKEAADAVYCSCAWREIEAALIFDPTLVNTVSPHKHRETVINRAIRQNTYITDAMVDRSQTLKEVALDYVSTYRGTNGFVQDIALKLADIGSLSIGQMRGALNVMVKEAKFETRHVKLSDGTAVQIADTRPLHVQQTEAYAGKKPRETPDSSDRSVFFVDFSNQLGEAVKPVDLSDGPHYTEGNGRVVPNGTYTVPVNDTGEYRVIKLTDCPESYNKPAGTQIAAFQSGSDNESDFTGFAFVNGATFKSWKAFFNIRSSINRALDKLLTTGRSGEFGKIWAMASGKCFICGRKLTVPISKQAGIGPICAANGGFDINALAALLIGNKDQAIEENDNRDRLQQSGLDSIDELFPD